MLIYLLFHKFITVTTVSSCEAAKFAKMNFTKDLQLEKLSALLEEMLLSPCDSRVKEKLTEAQNVVETVSGRSSNGINKFSLDGQVALVTGGGQGIGRAIAIALGEAGCKVAVADINLERAEAVANELPSNGSQSLAILADVSRKDEVEKMVNFVISTFGDLDIGINNAGIVFRSNAEETSEEMWGETLGVNLSGVFYCCQAEALHMLSKGRGRIINTSSMSARIVNRPQNQASYNVSKAGVVHLTKSLATEWADRGVTVNCISPGYINTALSEGEEFEELKRHWVKNIPMGRLGEVDEIIGGVLYLASSLSSYTTGLDLAMDGGYTCW